MDGCFSSAAAIPVAHNNSAERVYYYGVRKDAKGDGVQTGNDRFDDRPRSLRGDLRTWFADAHRDDGKRFVVHADEKLTAFVELQIAVRRRAG